MEGSAKSIGAQTEADLDTSMSRLTLSSHKASALSTSPPELVGVSASASVASSSSTSGGVSEDAINSVDQFLREALLKPRERLSVLRMEQDVEKFIQDPTREQMEFQQLPTSYLRLAAHRVALHYSLQSMVLLDNSLPDGSGSRIIVRKTTDSRLPLIRLADVPVDIPTEDSGVTKVAIKQRPQKWSQMISDANSKCLKTNNSKSMEERKEEYSKARARIFDSNTSSSSAGVVEKSESEPKIQESFGHGALGILKIEEKSLPGGFDMNTDRSSVDFSIGSSRSPRVRTEEPVGRFKTNSRVAIFRDREVDCKDPDYDRSYERYVQRFDPGFAFSGGPYTIQPMYSPALNYNAEFPQLGLVHRHHISSEHQPRPFPQHLPGPWVAASAPAGIGYGHPEFMMSPFGPNHVGSRTTSTLFLHSPQYHFQCPGMPLLHSHEHVHQPFLQSHMQQPDASYGLPRPR